VFADYAGQTGYMRVEGHPAFLPGTDGYADLVALGRMFISNSDLPDHLRNHSPLTPYDCSTFYGGDGRG
jgi:hypothetical protein